MNEHFNKKSQKTIICPTCNNTRHELFGVKNDYDLFRCLSCSLVFVDPMPSSKELDEFYQNYHKTSQYVGKIESKRRRAGKRIKSVMKYAKGKSFIDIGCNAGFAAEAARNLGLDANGIDLDRTAIDFAREHYPKVNFQATSIEELAKTGKRYDIIYCSEVIEHLPQVDDFLVALYEILQQDGVILLTTPDIEHYSIAKNIIDWDGIRPPEHLLYFSKKSLIFLLKKHNFKKINFKFSFKPTLKVIIRK